MMYEGKEAGEYTREKKGVKAWWYKDRKVGEGERRNNVTCMGLRGTEHKGKEY